MADVKALSDGGVGEAEDLAVGITLAAEQGANIIICSLSVEMDSPVLREAVAAAYENGAVIPLPRETESENFLHIQQIMNKSCQLALLIRTTNGFDSQIGAM